MKALVQRVTAAAVTVDDDTVGAIDRGMLVLLGVAADDTEDEAERLARRLLAWRMFADDEGRMNLNVRDAGGAVLVVSQFTLVADTTRGNRPGFSVAAPPEQAQRLYRHFVATLRNCDGLDVQTGRFGADMKVSLVNDGPVTFMLEAKAGKNGCGRA